MASFFIPPIRGLILDLDGVLWRDNESIGDLPEIFKVIQRKGIKVAFATNNATRSADHVQQKLAGFGVTIETNQVFNSSLAMTHLLKERFPSGGPIYVIGEQGLLNTLQSGGFYHSEENVLAVVAGLDRSFSYEKLLKSSFLIQAGVPFYGTNPDKTYPTPRGLEPGAYAVIGAIEIASGVKAILAGKPYPAIMSMALKWLDVKKEEALAVGDRLDTDILGGMNVGCRTALVMTGVSTPKDVEVWTPKPDLIINDFSTLVNDYL